MDEWYPSENSQSPALPTDREKRGLKEQEEDNLAAWLNKYHFR